MDPILKQLLADLDTSGKELKAFIDSGDLEAAEKAGAKVDEINGKIEARKGELDRLRNLAKKANDASAYLNDPAHRVPVPGAKKAAPAKAEGAIETGDSETDKLLDTGGFKSFGHFAHAVRTGSARGGRASEPSSVEAIKRWNDAIDAHNNHLVEIKAPSGMHEGADPDGAELVPRQFSNTVYRRITSPERLFGRLSPITVSGNSLEVPRLKENSRANGSRHGGVQAYWDGEAEQYTGSRPKFDNLNLKLNKLTVLTYVTDELLQDSAVALESWLNQVVPDEFDFKINDAIINGGGVKMPTGILNSGSKITVAAESGQGAGTIVYKNILKMHNQALPSARGRMLWLAHLECEPQLEQLYLATGTAHGNPVYLPQGGGASDVELARLKGKPVVITEQCSALGTEGDIILFDPADYACIVKGGIQSAMSIHLRFDYQETAFRWSFRMDGKPYNNTALSPFKGTTKVSQIVTLSSTRT